MSGSARCATCIHFEDPPRSFPRGYPYKRWASCRLLHDGYDRDPESDGPDDGRLAIPYDYEGYSAGLYVSPQFGCVQHQQK